MDKLATQIETFLAAPSFAVVGASDDPRKYGHRVLVCYRQNDLKAYPVNPKAETVLGQPSFPDLTSLPEKVRSISVITPPAVTAAVIDEAIVCGVENIWCQPGAEDWEAIERAVAKGLNVIAGGPCLLVVMRYRED